MKQLKIVCIGAAAVGKTTLLQCIANPNAAGRVYEPTQAIEVTDIELPDIGTSFRAWDFSGQEYLREYQSLHFKGADGAIIVFDLMRKDTLDALSEWIKLLLRVAGPIPIVLVGNKVDLRGTAVEEFMVTIKEGKNFAAELSGLTDYKVPYIEISAMHRTNFDHLFNDLNKFFESPDLASLAFSKAYQDVAENREEALIQTRDFLAEMVAIKTHALLEEENKIKSIIELIPDGILVLEVDGLQYVANKALRDLYWKCYLEEMPEITNWLEIPSDNVLIETIKLLFIEKHSESITIEPASGVFLQLSSALVEYMDKPPFGIIIQVRDVTSFIEFDNMRKRIVSSISHELRTPISVIFQSINNFLKFKDRITLEKQDLLLKIIQKNSILLAQLVEDLLVLSRIDERKIKLDWVKFDPSVILQEVLLQLEPIWDEKSITIDIDIKESLHLYGDPQKTSQVFRILIDNALKYSKHGTRIVVQATDQYIGKYNPNHLEGVLLEFIDQGRGIKEKDIPNLFERFFRANDVQDTTGTGLGLSIASEFVTIHQGMITVESEYGKGSTFIIFLPRLEEKPD